MKSTIFRASTRDAGYAVAQLDGKNLKAISRLTAALESATSKL
jgi:hypothetical protein